MQNLPPANRVDGVSRRRAMQGLAAGIGIAAAGAADAASSGQRPPLVTTGAGQVEGGWSGGIATFKGIPYGGPVDGANRWKRPSPPQPWGGVFRADHYGPRAVQLDSSNGRMVTPELAALLHAGGPPEHEWAPMGENCLTLNVWSPSLGKDAKLPVMVWLHGGGYFTELPPIWWNDGTALARTGEVVVVTVRHRLNAFGFLDLASMGAKDLPDAGNAGMLDLLRALEWVRENIAAFGGSSDNVTIFGESGGGGKVSTLLAMPAAKGLFHKAIIESGPTLRIAEREATAERARSVLKAAGMSANELDRFRALSPEDIQRANAGASTGMPDLRKGFAEGPVVDGVNVLTQPFDPVASLLSADVPIIIGTNTHEMAAFLGGIPGVFDLDWEGLSRVAPLALGPHATRLVDVYRQTRPSASPSDVLFLIASDQAMRVPSIKLAERKAQQGRAPVYMYLLAHQTNALGGKLRSPHGLDIPFVFNNPDIAFAGTDPGRYELARQMSGAWSSFARTGRPDHSSLPEWKPYTPTERATMVFDVKPMLVKDPGRLERLAVQEA